MSETKPIQALGQVEGNPIGCQIDALKPVIHALNEELATVMTLYHQYLKHHWLVRGPQFRDLHQFLKEQYQQVQTDGDDMAERIVTLGGVPISHPVAQAEASCYQHEPDGLFPLRQMLAHDLKAEQTICQHLRKHIQTALQAHDFGTEHLLKGVLLRAEKRADDLDHFLAGDSLEMRTMASPTRNLSKGAGQSEAA